MYPRRRLELFQDIVDRKRLIPWKVYEAGDGPGVGMTVFARNRRRLMDRLKSSFRSSVVVLEGESLSDLEKSHLDEAFSQEPYFYWLFGVLEPNFTGALDVFDETTYLFYPDDFEESLKECNASSEATCLRREFYVDFALPKSKAVETLKTLKRKYILSLGCPEKCGIQTVIALEKTKYVNPDVLGPAINRLFSVKLQREVEAIKFASSNAVDGVKFVIDCAVPGMYCHKLTSLFEDYVLSMGGCRVVRDMTFCCRATDFIDVCHRKGVRRYKRGVKLNNCCLCVIMVVLQYFGFYSSFGVTFPIAGIFSSKQETIYSIVLVLRQRLLGMLHPSRTKRELSQRIARILTYSLRYDLRILDGDLEEMKKVGLTQLFMPREETCQVLGVRDEVDQPLSALWEGTREASGVVLVLTTGCFFPKDVPEEMVKFLREAMDDWRDVGGVCMRETVLLKRDGTWVHLTDFPRQINALQAFMQRAKETRAPYEQYLQNSLPGEQE